MKFIDEMNENNITKEQIELVLHTQQQSYDDALHVIMGNKQKYLNNIKFFEADIFALEKIIKINKRAGNTYAVTRDEVQIKSYQLLANQHKMIKEVLISLDHSDSKIFYEDLNKHVIMNQQENHELLNVDYKPMLEIQSESKTLKQVKENIDEFYKLVEINEDLIGHLYLYKSKMYRLNRYSKYNIISLATYINNLNIVKSVNPFLEGYGLSIIKILFILILIVFIYFLRKIVFILFDKYILKLDFLNKYSYDIVGVIKKPVDLIIVVININMIIYVYDDFISIESVTRFFNIIYGIFFTVIVYKVLNKIATIKINEIDSSNSKVKNEVINLSMKMANFAIVIIGFLIVLYMAGVNLTAVLSGLGIGGFAVALAAKDSLANFFGTLSILFSDVYSQGDWIEVDGKEGTVVEIGLRVTTLRTFDNALIAIPNAILANKDVKNWNKRSLGRRIKMSLGVKYDSKVEDIQKAVKEIHHMLDKHPKIATINTQYNFSHKESSNLVSREDKIGVKKTLLVYLDEFSDSSINILVYCFSKTVIWDEWLEVKEDVMYKIMEIFEKNSLEFAFPSLSLYKEKEDI